MQFFEEEPWGWEANCYPSAVVAAVIANVNRDPKKKCNPFEVTDFIPGYKARPKKIDGTKLKAQLMQAAYAGLAGFKGKKARDS